MAVTMALGLIVEVRRGVRQVLFIVGEVGGIGGGTRIA